MEKKVYLCSAMVMHIDDIKALAKSMHGGCLGKYPMFA